MAEFIITCHLLLVTYFLIKKILIFYHYHSPQRKNNQITGRSSRPLWLYGVIRASGITCPLMKRSSLGWVLLHHLVSEGRTCSRWGNLHVEPGQRLQTVNESSRPRRQKTRWTQKTWPRRWWESLAVMPDRSPDPSCNLLLLPDAFLNREVCQVGQRMINFLRRPGQLKKHILQSRLTPSAHSQNTHPFFKMNTMAPSSRIRTTKPPAQAPRIRPMSSACWETSRALFESLQAAAK